jgi:hypothetical protein
MSAESEVVRIENEEEDNVQRSPMFGFLKSSSKGQSTPQKESGGDSSGGDKKIASSGGDNKMPSSAPSVELKDIEAVRTEVSLPSTHGKDYLLDQCPVGVTQNAFELAETPNIHVKRMMCDQEHILATFDVLFPYQKIPQWKIIYLLIITCGLYAIQMLVDALRQWCYKNKLCTPPVIDYTRGKMVITSKGRLICWDEHVVQIKTGNIILLLKS